ncbi:hypothetical protein D3C81_1722070 [compost metagenome]
MLRGHADAVAVGVGKLFVLALAAAMPDRADRVDHVRRGQAPARGDHCLAGGATAVRVADRAAGLHDGGAAGPVDGAVDAAAAQQAAVGRVDDGIDFHPGDVAMDYLQVLAGHVVSWFESAPAAVPAGHLAATYYMDCSSIRR